ncbi:nucleotidyl transferase AbiEii/AbiGii toxin family protein [Spirosoma oryzae]
MANPVMKSGEFTLAGGTALALQLGHRMSTDLDLFTNNPFDPIKLRDALRQTLGDRLSVHAMNEIGFRGFVDGVKIDVVYCSPYPGQV